MLRQKILSILEIRQRKGLSVGFLTGGRGFDSGAICRHPVFRRCNNQGIWDLHCDCPVDQDCQALQENATSKR